MLFSGALIQTVESGTIMYHNPIDQSSANRLLAMAKANHWMMQTYIDDVLRVPVHNHWIAGYESITGIHAVVAGDAFYEVSGCPSKILAYGEPEELVAMYQQMPARLQETAELRLENPESSLGELAEISGLTKSGLIHRLKKIAEIAKEIEGMHQNEMEN